MKKFNIGKKLKEQRQPLQPPEIGREPVDRKTVIRRKWFFRIVYTVVILLILWLLLKDLFITQTKGLVKIREITVTAPENGYFRPLCKAGDKVEPERPLGQIKNPEIEGELESLKETLSLLIQWRERIKEENEKRQRLERIKSYMKIASTTSVDITGLENQLNEAKKLRQEVKQQVIHQEEKIQQLKKLVGNGVVSLSDIQAEEQRLISLRRQLLDIEDRVLTLESRLKAIRAEKRLLSKYPEIQPMIAQIESIDEKISRIKSRIKVLSSSIKDSTISLPYSVVIQSVLPENRYVTKGETVITALRPDEYYIEAYVEKNKLDEVIIGRKVTIVLPDGNEIEGVIEEKGSSYILKPHILVGPLERRDLVLPVKIKPEKGVENVLHNNMPVDIIF
ncbi:HlyD family secretion protein [Persephonella sp.]